MAVIVTLSIAASVMLILRLLRIHLDAEAQKEKLAAERSWETTIALAEDSLVNMVIWAADKTEDEFWILQHDYLTLGEQVKDVLDNPDHYKPLAVEEPKEENQGKYTLQLMLPEGFDKDDPKMRDTMGRLANLGPMMEEIVRGNEGYTTECYITTPDGATLAMDDMSGDKFKDGKLPPYDARNREWYKDASSAGRTVFSVPVHSYFYDYEEIVFAVPLYRDGELVAMLEGATRTEVLKKKLSERNMGETGFTVLVNEKGQLLYSPRESGELEAKDEPYDVRKTADPGLSDLIDKAIKGNTGFAEIVLDGEAYYAAYAPFETYDWAQVMFISSDELNNPSRKLIKDMDRISETLADSYLKLIWETTLVLLILLAAITFAAQVAVTFPLKKLMLPMNLMAEKIRNMSGENSVFEVEETYKTGDEIQLLAETFADYSERNRIYLQEIVKITGEKERAEAEMEAAAQIQAAMLPKKTGPIYDREEFEIYGDMIPAKGVGGDLYDYFLIDEDHLAVVIGDVSGKGVPASIFMVLVKNAVQSRLLQYHSDLEKAMTEVNNILIRESVKSMFVTLWAGVLRLSDGNLEFVNAGHCLAAMCKKDGIFTIEMDDHSMIAGAIDKAKFKVNEIKLEAGDTLYLYTDGVTEARNSANEMFTTDRLLSALNEDPLLAPSGLDERVIEHVREFVGDTEQFDDITTLCIRYKPGDKKGR